MSVAVLSVASLQMSTSPLPHTKVTSVIGIAQGRQEATNVMPFTYEIKKLGAFEPPTSVIAAFASRSSAYC